MHEEDTEALQSGDLDAQKLLPVVGIPNSDFVDGGSGKDLRIPEGERDVVDTVIMAGVPELGHEGIGVDPVNVGLRSPAEEMSEICSEGQGCDTAHHFVLFQQLHVLDGNPGQLALTSAHQDITVGQDPDGGDAQAEQLLERAHSLVDGFVDVDLEDVSSFGAAVDILVVVVDGGAGEMAADVSKVGIEGLDFLVDLVNGQYLDPVVQDCDELVAVSLEEHDLVDHFLVGGSIERLATLHVPHHQHVST